MFLFYYIIILSLYNQVLLGFNFKFNRNANSNTWKVHSKNYDFRNIILQSHLSTLDIDDNISAIRKWFFVTKNFRPEICISESTNVNEVYSDLWKGTIISNNILSNLENSR